MHAEVRVDGGPGLGRGGRGALDRGPVRAHAPARRRDQPRGGHRAPRPRPADRRPPPSPGGVRRDDAAHPPRRDPRAGSEARTDAAARPRGRRARDHDPARPTRPARSRRRPVSRVPVRAGCDARDGRAGPARRARAPRRSRSADRRPEGWRHRTGTLDVGARPARLLLRAGPSAARGRADPRLGCAPRGTRSRTLDLSVEAWDAGRLDWPDRVGVLRADAHRDATRPPGDRRRPTGSDRRSRWPATACTARRWPTAPTSPSPARPTTALLAWVDGHDDPDDPVIHLGRDAARPGAPAPGAGAAAAARPLHPSAAGRHRAARRVRRGEPGVCAPLPALPRPRRLRRPDPHRGARRGARRRRPAGRGRSRAPHLRRPRLPQRRRTTPAASSTPCTSGSPT